MKPEVDSGGWYVAQLKRNGFEQAVVNLGRQFETFMPMQKKCDMRANLKMYCGPCFPVIYLSVLEPIGAIGERLIQLLGFHRLVGFEKSATLVPEKLIAGLRARCDREDVSTAG